jgi:hypothetical protein
MGDRRRSFPRAEGRRTRRPGHRSGGIRTQPADYPTQTRDSQRTRLRGLGRFRSDARRRRRSHHAGSRQTAGRTARGCIRHGYPPRGCHRRGSIRRGRRRHRGPTRYRSPGPHWDAGRPRHGHAPGRQKHHRKHRASRHSRRASRSAPLRNRLGRRRRRATRRRTRLDSNNRRPARRTGRSHPSRQSLLGVRNRQSHGPRHRWGVRAHHRRCRAPARCRLQPLKPPPERIISSPYPHQHPRRPCSESP